MRPKRCNYCKWAGEGGGCLRDFKGCKAWRQWFHEHWQNIHREGQRIKEQAQRRADE